MHFHITYIQATHPTTNIKEKHACYLKNFYGKCIEILIRGLNTNLF